MLDFIRDIYASFRQTSLERVKSPFLGAFVFSWLGFNWQMLAILFFSKNDIEKRLFYIDEKFGVESFIIGPLFTSALIAFLLPQINKIVTKIQAKPNTDTVEMSLESKIKIAKKQQEIAEIEARKKLAEKKEEKYIEESIYQIKKEHDEAIRDLELGRRQYKEISSNLNEAVKSAAEYQSQLTVEKEARTKTEKEILLIKEQAKVLTEKLISANNDNNKAKVEIAGLMRENDVLKEQNLETKSYNNHLLGELSFISEKIPQIVRLVNIDGKMEITFNKTNYDKVLSTMNLYDINAFTQEQNDSASFDEHQFKGQTIQGKNTNLKNSVLKSKTDNNYIIAHNEVRSNDEK